MATYFVGAGGSNTAPYDTEAKAATSLATIAAIWTSSDVVKVNSTFAESVAAPSYTFPTSVGLKLLSVTFNGSGTGGLAAGASITCSTNGNALNIVSGYAYVYGISFIGNNGSSTANLVTIMSGTAVTSITFDNCTISAPGTSSSARITFGGASSNVVMNFNLINCTLSNGANKTINLRNGRFTADNLTLAGSALTSVFQPASADTQEIDIKNSNLTGVTWTNLVVASGIQMNGYIRFTNCKLQSGFVLSTGAFPYPGSAPIELIDCHSGDTQYYYQQDSWYGTITTDNTVYYDSTNGTDSLSLKLVSSANVTFFHPMVSPPITHFNSSLSSINTTVECVSDGTTFTNAELWQETTAKNTSGSTLGTTNRSDRVADILATPANQESSSVSWTGTGGFGSEIKQKLVSGSFTPAEIGYITTQVFLAKPNATVYINPKNLATSSKQYITPLGAYINEGAGSTDPGEANVKTGVGYTFEGAAKTGTYTGSDRWSDPGVSNVLSGTSYLVDGVTATGTYSPNFSDPGTANVLTGVNYIYAGVTQTGSLSAPIASSGTAGTVDINALKENIRFILNDNNTTTAAAVDLSSNMSTRVKYIMKVNPEMIDLDVNLYPCVTVFASRKRIQERTIASNQVVGKRRADLILTIMGLVWNDITVDFKEDGADDDVENLMENIEAILRHYTTINNLTNWQFPLEVAYHSVSFSEEAHMRIGVMELQVSVFY